MDGCGTELSAVSYQIFPDTKTGDQDENTAENGGEEDDKNDDGTDTWRGCSAKPTRKMDENTFTDYYEAMQTCQRSIPAWLQIMKHYANGTGLFQAHDVSKSHGIFTTLMNNNTDVLVKNRDEGKLPPWYHEIDRFLTENGVVGPASHRSFMKFFANIEHWLFRAFADHATLKGYALSSQWPWNLLAFMKRFAGYRWLEDLDFQFIEYVFPTFIWLAYGNGNVSKATIEYLVENWCGTMNSKTLSLEARHMLATHELNRRTGPLNDEDNIVNSGAVLLTHPMVMENQALLSKKNCRRL